MSSRTTHPSHPVHDVEDDRPEPGAMPVEPDQGPVPPVVPDQSQPDAPIDPVP